MATVNWTSGLEEAVSGGDRIWRGDCNASVVQCWAMNLLSSASNKSIEETLALHEDGLNNISSSSSTPAVDNGTWEDQGSRGGGGGDELYRHTVSVSTVYVVAYATVFLLGLVGNCFVIAVVYRMPRMRTVTNYFIVNLAVADILVLLFCLPATLLSSVFVPWMLGGAMCKLVAYVQGVSVVASVDSLVAVSFDRFLAICFPMKFQITNRRARIILAIIWVLALTTTIPWPLYFNLVPVFGERPDIYFCVEQWPTKRAGTLYFVLANLVFCFLFPLALISLCYLMIWIKVSRRDIPTDSKDPHMERMQQRSKVKTVKMLVAVVLCFVLSWLPLYAIFTRIKLGNDVEEWEISLLAIATPIAQWLGSSNSCINPILYAFFNQKYRRGFAAIMKSKSCCGTLRVDDFQYRTPALSIHRSTYQSSTSMRRNTLSTRHRENNSSPSNMNGNSGVSQIYRELPVRKSLACANV